MCGECIPVCPTKAIRWKGSKIILPENEIPGDADEKTKTEIKKKQDKRVFILKLIASILMVATLGGALVYYNFIHEEPEATLTPGVGEFNIDKLDSNVVIINFWGTWCTPCVNELPHFDEIAENYASDVTVVAVHSTTVGGMSPEDFVNTYYPESKMIFVRDSKSENSLSDDYYSALGGESTYPMTVVLDRNGIVTDNFIGALSYSELEDAIEKALASDTDDIDPNTLRVGGDVGKKCPSMNLEYVDVYGED